MAYLSDQDVELALAALETTHPALCARIPLPHESIVGVTCHAMRVGSPTPSTYGVLILGAMHGDEVGTADACMQLAGDLANAIAAGTGITYGAYQVSAADIAGIGGSLDVIVVPVVNPHGLRTSDRHNANGVDINRNFDFLWDAKTKFDPAALGANGSDVPGSKYFHGNAPNSEPEARNIVHLVDTYPQIRAAFDMHAATDAGSVFYAWSDDDVQSVDPTMNFANPAYDGKRGTTGAEGTAYAEYLRASHLTGALTTAQQIADAMNLAIGGTLYNPQAPASFYKHGIGGIGVDYLASRRFLGKPRIDGYGLELPYPTNGWDAQSPMDIRAGAAGALALCMRVLQAKHALDQLLSHVVDNYDLEDFITHLQSLYRNRPPRPIPGPDPAAIRRSRKQAMRHAESDAPGG